MAEVPTHCDLTSKIFSTERATPCVRLFLTVPDLLLQVLRLVTCMLLQQRIVFISSSYALLTIVMEVRVAAGVSHTHAQFSLIEIACKKTLKKLDFPVTFPESAAVHPALQVEVPVRAGADRGGLRGRARHLPHGLPHQAPQYRQQCEHRVCVTPNPHQAHPRIHTPRSQRTKNKYHACERQSKWAVSSFVYTNSSTYDCDCKWVSTLFMCGMS